MTEGGSASEKFTCPRRHDLLAFGSGVEGEDEWRDDGTCTYCGSMSPEDLFQAIEDGNELGPTDKNYKVYVKTDDPRKIKFYFQHLGEADRKRFVDLLNEKKINIGYPGFFYRLPFFVKPEEPRPEGSAS